MAVIFFPPQLRDVTGSEPSCEVTEPTVRMALEELNLRFPNLCTRLLDADGKLIAGWAVVVDGVPSPDGLRSRLEADSEVHFLPAIGGG